MVSAKTVDIIGDLIRLYFDSKDATELLHLNMFRSIPTDYFNQCSTCQICVELIHYLNLKSPLAAGAFARKLLNELFSTFQNVKYNSLSFDSVFELYMFKTPSDEERDIFSKSVTVLITSTLKCLRSIFFNASKSLAIVLEKR